MENTLVWCKTKAQLVELLTEAKRKGYNIDSPTDMANRFWANYHENTVVNLNGNGRSITYCYKDWYINHPNFGKIITADKFFGRKPILITRKGRVVTAEDKNTGEKAIATCSPTDTFDFGTGAMIAVARLMAKTPDAITDDVKAEWKKVLGIEEVEVYTDDDRNFKVGDRVVVRDWGDMAKEYGVENNGLSPDGCATRFTTIMKHLCGRTATITDTDDDYVRVEFDDKSGDTDWYFRRWMFNPSDSDKPTTKFKVGDLVTLKDNLEIHNRYDGITLLENMYRNGHRKPIKVIGVDCNEHYDCVPFSSCDGSTVSYWYSEEMLEPWDENKIREGDKVHVKKGCTKDRYDTYYQWLKDNISDIDLLLGFERKDSVSTTDTYTVVKIAPHGHLGDVQLAFIKRTNGIGDTFSYLYDIDALKKVTE